jgi:hypothetical protein
MAFDRLGMVGLEVAWVAGLLVCNACWVSMKIPEYIEYKEYDWMRRQE